jgi:CBS domain containing-hemolysin-like protein
MTPRREIVAVDIRDNLTEVRGLFVESNLSRIIVTDGDLDNVVGYLHVQQLFSSPKNLRSVVLPIAFVPAAMAVDDLLQKFIRSRSSIACVVDEYGGVNGLVTLEDALEQLFGDIDDEHDQEEFIETKVAENEYLFSGRLDINYLNEAYPEISLPEGEYHTLSGYIIHETQNIPEQSEKIELKGIIFLIELVSDRKIETVRVLLPAAN